MTQVVSPLWVPPPQEVLLGVTRGHFEQAETTSLRNADIFLQADPEWALADSADAIDIARQLPQASLKDSKFCDFISRH